MDNLGNTSVPSLVAKDVGVTQRSTQGTLQGVTAETANIAPASGPLTTRLASGINDVVVASIEARPVREPSTETTTPAIPQAETSTPPSSATPDLAVPLTATPSLHDTPTVSHADLPYDTPESSAFATFLRITRRRSHSWTRMDVDSEAPLEHDPRHITGAHVGIIMTVLVTVLQKNPSSDPRVTVLQRTAIVVCLVSMILYYLQSRRVLRHDPNGSLIERVLVHYPYLLLFACGILYLLSVAIPSPRSILIPLLLTILAVLPIVAGPYLPVQFTLTTTMLFPLGLVTFFILLPFLPSDWLA